MIRKDISTTQIHTINALSTPELHEQSESSRPKHKPRPIKPKSRIVINISCCKYEIVRHITKKLLGWRLTKSDEEDCDLFWCDAPITPEKFKDLKQHQKINHFPSMTSLGRKNQLSRNLTRLRKIFPKDYNFFPRTWNIPTDISDLRRKFHGKHRGMLIVKPEASCQGKGIYITHKLEDIKLDERMVVQQYIHRPLLIDELKFDLRIYVLVTGCDPLRIFIHEQGLARFATESYMPPSNNNLKEVCMHLTNYAINKHSDKFQFNDDSEDDGVGHKRSLASVFKRLASEGHDTAALWNGIKSIVVKTLCSVQPTLSHTYKACQPDELSNSMCFEILGFDILIDRKLKPWLLEVNQSPSFTTDTPLDRKIKLAVIKDALDIVGMKKTPRNEGATRWSNRMGLYIRDSKISRIERKLSIKQQRDDWENSHLGGYQRIYPDLDNRDYDAYISAAFDCMQDLSGPKFRKPEVSEPQLGMGQGSKIEMRRATDSQGLPPVKSNAVFAEVNSLRSISVNLERKIRKAPGHSRTNSIHISLAERYKRSKETQDSATTPFEEFLTNDCSSHERLHNNPDSSQSHHKDKEDLQNFHKYSYSKHVSPQDTPSLCANSPEVEITPLDNLRYLKLPPSISSHKKGTSLMPDSLYNNSSKLESLTFKHAPNKSYDLEATYEDKSEQFPMM